jgi:hypothetical protein
MRTEPRRTPLTCQLLNWAKRRLPLWPFIKTHRHAATTEFAGKFVREYNLGAQDAPRLEHPAVPLLKSGAPTVFRNSL